MNGETVTLEPIKAPVVAIARRLEIAFDASRDNWPGVRRLVASDGEQYDNLRTIRVVVDDDEEWERRSREGILAQVIRYALIDRVLPTLRIVTVLVDDAGDYRRVEVTQHEERGAPIVAWLVDLVHDLWLDDASTMPTVKGDQAPDDQAPQGDPRLTRFYETLDKYAGARIPRAGWDEIQAAIDSLPELLRPAHSQIAQRLVKDANYVKNQLRVS